MATNSFVGGTLAVGFNGTSIQIVMGASVEDPGTTIDVDGGDDFVDTTDMAGVFAGTQLLTNLVYTGFTITDDQGNVLLLAENANTGAFRLILEDTTLTINGQDVVNGTASTILVIPDSTPTVAVSTLCFLSKTNILTTNGYVPVEDLSINDELIIDPKNGQTEPVKFIFKREYQHPFVNKKETYPICIKQSALADNVPSKDLFVSSDHAIMIDGILAQAGALVNGVSIYQVSDMDDSFTYYHIELANHSLIISENVLTETYIDNVERESFDNYAEYEALYGKAEGMAELEFPRAKSARQLPNVIKQKLLAHGEKLYSHSSVNAA